MKQTLLVGMLAVTMLPVSAGLVEEPPQDKKAARKGWLGVSIQDVSETLAEDEGLKGEDGAYISDVQDDSPADSVGLKKGDVIVEFAGRKIYDSDDLAKSVSRTEPGTKASIVVLRKGERKTFTVTIGKLPRRSSYAWSTHGTPRFRFFHGANSLGMSTLSLNDQLARYFGAPNDEGVLVERVEKGSAAEKAGIAAGDVLLRIGSRAIDEVDDLWRALEKYDEGDTVEIEILRKGAKRTVTVVIEDAGDEPWGLVAPTVPHAPRIHVRPKIADPSFDFEVKIAPELEALQRKIEMIPRLDERIQRKIRVVTSTRSI